MKYSEILRQLARKENVSVKEIEQEMQQAIDLAGLNCSVKEFIETTKKAIKGRYIVH